MSSKDRCADSSHGHMQRTASHLSDLHSLLSGWLCNNAVISRRALHDRS
jgi:hypothetical protein